jgi:hypothetical protein
MSIEAMKQALEALKYHMEQTRPINMTQNAIHALRQAIEEAALAKPELPMSPEHLPQYIATNNIKPTTPGGGGAGGELAKPEQAEKQEPVNTMPTKIVGPNLEQILNAAGFYKREWVGLTDDEIHKVVDACTPDEAEQEELNDFARAVRFAEAKLKEKNGGN